MAKDAQSYAQAAVLGVMFAKEFYRYDVRPEGFSRDSLGGRKASTRISAKYILIKNVAFGAGKWGNTRTSVTRGLESGVVRIVETVHAKFSNDMSSKMTKSRWLMLRRSLSRTNSKFTADRDIGLGKNLLQKHQFHFVTSRLRWQRQLPSSILDLFDFIVRTAFVLTLWFESYIESEAFG
ncbi:hypothetical protein AOQ84DRAFT_425193 [Glonium stellatum]|uniref:Uncharacterized protein n=1 Tax=Glonium stellatum TaxID=574774 RepID=A0A8E2F5U1_9PEZI|nr:hypothetical protein AOQ84DRAFT_425193 [Glonium stellatum]